MQKSERIPQKCDSNSEVTLVKKSIIAFLSKCLKRSGLNQIARKLPHKCDSNFGKRAWLHAAPTQKIIPPLSRSDATIVQHRHRVHQPTNRPAIPFPWGTAISIAIRECRDSRIRDGFDSSVTATATLHALFPNSNP